MIRLIDLDDFIAVAGNGYAGLRDKPVCRAASMDCAAPTHLASCLCIIRHRRVLLRVIWLVKIGLFAGSQQISPICSMTFDISPEARVGVHIFVANHCCASVDLWLRRYSKASVLHFFTHVSACFICNLSSGIVVRAVENVASHKDSVCAVNSEVGGTCSHGSVQRSVGH